MICMTIGFDGIRGLGVKLVNGLSLVPMPPARINAFMKDQSGAMLTTLFPRRMTVPRRRVWSAVRSSVSSSTMFMYSS